jgi:hypothetical protein
MEFQSRGGFPDVHSDGSMAALASAFRVFSPPALRIA